MPDFANTTMYGVGHHDMSVQFEAPNIREVRDNLNSEVSSKYQAREHLGA